MSPHSPFVFGPTGGSHASIFSNLDNLSRYKNNLYIDQIQFVNYKLEHIIDKLLNTDNPPIIIIQSDHGKRGATNDDEPAVRNNKQLNNFRAYYIPNGDRNIELENASPVNTTCESVFGTNSIINDLQIFWSIGWNCNNFKAILV